MLVTIHGSAPFLLQAGALLVSQPPSRLAERLPVIDRNARSRAAVPAARRSAGARSRRGTYIPPDGPNAWEAAAPPAC
jgi:hypothetical protein